MKTRKVLGTFLCNTNKSTHTSQGNSSVASILHAIGNQHYKFRFLSASHIQISRNSMPDHDFDLRRTPLLWNLFSLNFPLYNWQLFFHPPITWHFTQWILMKTIKFKLLLASRHFKAIIILLSNRMLLGITPAKIIRNKSQHRRSGK